jgi:GntR family transcriptional regulator
MARTALFRESPISLYEQIAHRLQEEIEAGLYEPSGRLPSEAQIGARFDVSRVTVRLAIDRLVADGLVVRRQGKGSYAAVKQVRHGLDVLRSFHESLLEQGLNASMRLLEKRLVALPPELRLHFGSAGRALFLKRLHLVDGGPVAVGFSHLPQALSSASWEEVELQPSYNLLASRLGEAPARADMHIRAQPADGPLALTLEVAQGDALLVLERTSYFASGVCCDHSCFYIRPERYAFVMSSSFR